MKKKLRKKNNINQLLTFWFDDMGNLEKGAKGEWMSSMYKNDELSNTVLIMKHDNNDFKQNNNDWKRKQNNKK